MIGPLYLHWLFPPINGDGTASAGDGLPVNRGTIPIPFQDQTWQVYPQKFRALGLSEDFLPRRAGLPAVWFTAPPGKIAGSGEVRAEAPKKTTAQDWFAVLPTIGDAILRADFDAYNLPFSRNVPGNPDAGTRLLRSSEYKPKAGPYPGSYVEISEGIFGRAHGEIRPIKDRDESLVTRVTLDYQGGEVKYHLPKIKKLPLSYLELDCFTAVTPPTMTFDFSQGSKSVQSIGRDGNVKYENACIKRKFGEDIPGTPWDSEAPAPPKTKAGQNPDWMFYFQPIESTLGSTIVRRYINKKLGSLYLWANNPTFGFTDKSHYDKLGIRYNTWPRKFGDLLRFFSPLFDKTKREALKQGSPFLNPNTEYLDENGKRQKIPNDPLEVLALNEKRKKMGLEEVTRSRGPAVDWVFTDLFDDPKRMAATPADRWPAMHFRLQFKPDTVLDLPVGKVAINPETEVRISYESHPVVEEIRGEKRTRARTVLSVELGPLDLGPTDLSFGGYSFHVGEQLRVEKLQIKFPFEQEYGPDGKSWKLVPQNSAIQIKMEGLKGSGIKIEDRNRGVRYGLEGFQLEALTFKHHKEWAQAKLEGLSGTGLAVYSEMGSMELEQAAIPEITMQARHDLTDLWVKVGEIQAKGKTHIEPNYGNKTQIDLEGASKIGSIFFRRKKGAENTSTQLRFKVEGELPKATIRSPYWGQANLSMQEGKISHRLRGDFEAKVVQKNDDPSDKGQLDYQMSLTLPYTSFDLSTPVVRMPPGGSTLRNGIVRISRDKLSFEGDLNWHAEEISAPGTDLFRWKDFTVKPHLEDLHVAGSAQLVYTADGFHLKKRPGGLSPIRATFKLSDSSFSHFPHFSEAELKAHPELQVIQTGVDIDEARVVMSDIQEVQYETVREAGKAKGRILRLESGPMVLHHIRGSGDIWVDTALWSWLKGSFPHFGEPLSSLPKSEQTPKPKAKDRPDVKALIQHFDPATQKMLWDDTLGDYSNFVRIGGISVGPDPDHPEDSDRSLTQFEDLVIYAHETGNRWQFAAVGIPRLGFLQRLNPKGKPRFHVFTDEEPIYTHIYLKDPLRGFNPFLLKSPKPYRPSDKKE